MNTLTRDKWNKTNEAIDKISALGYKVDKKNENELHFLFKNKRVIYYPKKEWASGASITDCRGLGKLLQQINTTDNNSLVTIKQVKDKLVESIKEARGQSKKNIANEEMCIRFLFIASATASCILISLPLLNCTIFIILFFS